MRRILDDGQLTAGPVFCQFPCRHQRRFEIEPSLNEVSGYSCELSGIGQERAFLQPGVMKEVMRNDPGACQKIARIRPSARKTGGIGKQDRGGLPVVPVPGGLRRVSMSGALRSR
jgi:hypothetical protein